MRQGVKGVQGVQQWADELMHVFAPIEEQLQTHMSLVVRKGYFLDYVR